MDAIAVLKEQHQKVRNLFRQCEQLGKGELEQVEPIVQELCQRLTIHDKIERDIFYPQLLSNEQTKDLVLEGCEEHHLMTILLKQLSEIDSSDETYMAKVTVLKEVVEHHLQEEEGQMFPQASKLLKRDVLDQLGQKLQASTEQMLQREPQITITMLDQVGLETPTLSS